MKLKQLIDKQLSYNIISIHSADGACVAMLHKRGMIPDADGIEQMYNAEKRAKAEWYIRVLDNSWRDNPDVIYEKLADRKDWVKKLAVAA